MSLPSPTKSRRRSSSRKCPPTASARPASTTQSGFSPRGNTRHAARIKVAIDPPQAVKPDGKNAAVAIHDGSLVEGDVPPHLLNQLQQFIELNRDVLLEYWDYKILTDELEQRLKKL